MSDAAWFIGISNTASAKYHASSGRRTDGDQRRHRQHRPERHPGRHVGAPRSRSARRPTSPPSDRRRTKVSSTSFDAEKRADHREHLDVAEAHRLVLAQAVTRPPRSPRAGRRRAGCRASDIRPGGREQLNAKPDDDARQRDDVGQNLVLEIDGEQHDQRAGEQQPAASSGVDAEHVPVRAAKNSRGHGLDDRILQRDRRAGTRGSARASAA